MQTKLFRDYKTGKRTLPAPGDELLWRDQRFTIRTVVDEGSRFAMTAINHETGRDAVVLSTDDYIHFAR